MPKRLFLFADPRGVPILRDSQDALISSDCQFSRLPLILLLQFWQAPKNPALL